MPLAITGLAAELEELLGATEEDELLGDTDDAPELEDVLPHPARVRTQPNDVTNRMLFECMKCSFPIKYAYS